MHYHSLQHSSGICMGHSITSKEVVKYFLRAVNLLLVGFILKIMFSSRKQQEALNRAAWCLQSRCGSGTYSGFAVSRLGVAPSLAEPPLEFPDEFIAWLPVYCMIPNRHLPNECLGRVWHFLLIPVFLEGYLLMSRRGGSFPSYVESKDRYLLCAGSTCEEWSTVSQKNNLGTRLNFIPGNDSLIYLL